MSDYDDYLDGSNSLYLVKCRGIASEDPSSRVINCSAYVVAYDPTSAERVMEHFLRENVSCSREDRQVVSIKLLAKSVLNPSCGCRLFLDTEKEK